MGIEELIFGTDGSNFLRGSSANEAIFSMDGNDYINASRGDDYVDGGDGRDSISGGSGNDILLGGDGNDNIRGNRGDDLIIGGRGDDNLRGSSGDDTFVFAYGDGHDRISGFRAGAGTEDRIDLSWLGEDFDTFEEVMAVASRQSFFNTELDFGEAGSILLSRVQVSQLSEDDFIF